MTDAATAARRVVASLDSAEDITTFSCKTTLPGDALTLSIKNGSPLQWPVTESRARTLFSLSSPAPFGQGRETVLDPTVRDVGEISARKLQLDRKVWNRTLAPALDEMREALGLPAGRLTARVDKLLVYGPGQFFKPHRDTERADDMVGTLVVVLPSSHKGGTLVVSHRDETRRFVTRDTLAPTLRLYAFYASCEHEVRPVTEGFRIVLSHTLHFRAAATTDAPETNDDLRRALADYFDPSDRTKDRYGRPVDKLVYLLDHAYSARSLGWNRMKSVDRPRAQALKAVAAEMSLRAHLALVSVTETWSATVDEPRYYRGRGRRRYASPYDDNDDDDDGAGHRDEANALLAETHYDLEELIERGASLDHWRDPDDRAVTLPALGTDEDELCWTLDLESHPPELEEYEGYMGNYGNTLQREYRRAAVVLWPTTDHYRILARSGRDGQAALHQLALDAGKLGAAALNLAIESLFDVWPGAERDKGPDALRSALALARKLDSAELTLDLFHRLSIASLTDALTKPLLELGVRHGEPFCRQLFDAWLPATEPGGDHQSRFERRKALPRGRWFTLESDPDRLEWLPHLPAFCEQARASGAAAWLGVPTSAFDTLLELVQTRHIAQHRLASSKARARHVARERLDVLALVDAAINLDDAPRLERVVFVVVAGMESYASTVALALLERLHRPATIGIEEADRDALTRNLGDLVRRRIDDATRREGDWRIDDRPDCTCADCQTLAEFLSSTDAAVDLPLAKDRRRHLHGAIGALEIPVSHTTRREGRPFVLELRKSHTLFEDAARRVGDEEAVAARLAELQAIPDSRTS